MAHRVTIARLRAASILAGGAAGALARAGVGEAIPTATGQWPWATFTVNAVGALVLGWVTTRLAERVAPTRYWRFLLGTGLCGALTAFSTIQIETIRLAKDGYPGTAIGYAVASLALGMACAIAGTLVARARSRRCGRSSMTSRRNTGSSRGSWYPATVNGRVTPFTVIFASRIAFRGRTRARPVPRLSISSTAATTG